jgi:hypothetical protein
MNDVDQQVVADIVVIEVSANSEILRRQYNESKNFTVNETKTAFERLNRELSALADQTMGKIAFDVADAIEKSRLDSAAASGAEGSKPNPSQTP